MGFASFFLKGKRSNSKKTSKVDSSTTNTTTYVCRDELDKMKKPKIKKQVKFDLEPKFQNQADKEIISHEEQQKCVGEGVDGDDNANNNGVTVKILMKKEDAARLLLKCREGGVLEFMDVAHELVSSSNVRVLSSTNIHSSSNNGSLKAIPE